MTAWITAVPDWDFFLFGACKGCFFLSQSFSREYSPPERSQVNGGRGAWEKNEKGLKLLASCQRKYRLRWERAWHLRLKVNHTELYPLFLPPFSLLSPLSSLCCFSGYWKQMRPYSGVSGISYTSLMQYMWNTYWRIQVSSLGYLISRKSLKKLSSDALPRWWWNTADLHPSASSSPVTQSSVGR